MNGSNGKKQGQNSEVGPYRPPVEHRFKKGKSGNPHGRPKGESLTTKLRRVLEEPDNKFGTKADKLIAVMAKHAYKGNVRLLLEIFERMDGPVPAQSNNTHDVLVTVRHVDEMGDDRSRFDNSTAARGPAENGN